MIIDHRDYYNRGSIEAIDAIESACTALADLKKARYYLDRLIAEEEKRLGVAEEHAAAMPTHFEQDRVAMAEDTK